MSKASVSAAVQASLALCATCDHGRGEHPDDQDCNSGLKDKDGNIVRPCECREYWPIRRQTEEKFAVTDWTLKLGGVFSVLHKRRAETEFWDKLQTGHRVELRVIVEVGPKGFRPKRTKGILTSVTETRPASLVRVRLVDPATGDLE